MAERGDDCLDLESRVPVRSERPDVREAGTAAEVQYCCSANELLPSQLVELDGSKLSRNMSGRGRGATSHGSIHRGSDGHSTPRCDRTRRTACCKGTPVHLDGEGGWMVYRYPEVAHRIGAHQLAERRARRAASKGPRAGGCARTADGVRIEVFAKLAPRMRPTRRYRNGREALSDSGTDVLFLDRVLPQMG